MLSLWFWDSLSLVLLRTLKLYVELFEMTTRKWLARKIVIKRWVTVMTTVMLHVHVRWISAVMTVISHVHVRWISAVITVISHVHVRWISAVMTVTSHVHVRWISAVMTVIAHVHVRWISAVMTVISTCSCSVAGVRILLVEDCNSLRPHDSCHGRLTRMWHTLLNLMDTEDRGTALLRNVGNYLPVDTS